jgi:hypothetical protein
MNSSTGGISIDGGENVFDLMRFEGNSPSFSEFHSLRRNLCCMNEGRVELKNLKGGDGLLPNSSLFFLSSSSSSSDCVISLLIPLRDSLMFIPSIDDIKKSSNSSHCELKYEGNLFLPCSLSLYLIHVLPSSDSSSSPSDSLKPIINVEWENETVCYGRVEKSLVDEAEDEVSVFGCLLFDSYSRTEIDAE